MGSRIKLTPTIAENDVRYKVNHAKEFLQKGHQVKVSVFFKGRMIVYQDKGKETLLRFVEELLPFGTCQNLPKLVGKNLQITLNPKKK
jgi:translation initiation factor IF-3